MICRTRTTRLSPNSLLHGLADFRQHVRGKLGRLGRQNGRALRPGEDVELDELLAADRTLASWTVAASLPFAPAIVLPTLG